MSHWQEPCCLCPPQAVKVNYTKSLSALGTNWERTDVSAVWREDNLQTGGQREVNNITLHSREQAV